MLYRLKNFISVLLAASFALLIAVGVRAVNVSYLADLNGERTYYLDSASSQGLRASSLSLSDLARVKGECVRIDLSENDGGGYSLNDRTPEEIARSIAESYGAEILFVEEVCGVTSFYCYTPRWNNGIMLYGRAVNLHVAIGEETCAVGTPIVFDGF